MAKGTQAKENLIQQFMQAPGIRFAGQVDNKDYYFWSTENGEQVQIKVNMTCPKIPMQFADTSGDMNWEDDDVPAAPAAKPKEMSADEQATLERLMKELNL